MYALTDINLLAAALLVALGLGRYERLLWPPDACLVGYRAILALLGIWPPHRLAFLK